MSHVLVIGSAETWTVAPLKRIPSPGETILIDDIRLVSGGKGANAAVSAARLGADVQTIGCVGDDSFGQTLRNGLIDEGIGCLNTSARACARAAPPSSCSTRPTRECHHGRAESARTTN
ncbi:MAG: PfkB family carbohydrate kinase [Phycisphaerales bacterium]